MKKYYKMILWIFIISNFKTSFSVEFDHKENKISDSDIKYFAILGERCSGTNYVSCLIKQNIPDLKSKDVSAEPILIPHKHFIPWVIGNCDHFTSVANQLKYTDVLYIVLIRDIYDWLRSFYITPHVVHDSLKTSFQKFLTSPWLTVPSESHFDNNYIIKNFHDLFLGKDRLIWNQPLFKWINMIDDQDPITNKPFKNILCMRERKYQNYIAFKKYANNIIYVRYEDVKENPEEFLTFIEKISNKHKTAYIPWTKWKDSNQTYSPKKYFDFDHSQLDFINENVNWDLEMSFGYEKKYDCKEEVEFN